MRRPATSQRGDTLIEVILALIILSTILIVTISLARLSQVQSSNDQSRQQATNFLQQQYEALRQYRNTHTWDEFVQRGLGMRFLQHHVFVDNKETLDCSGYTPLGSVPATTCFHMERAANPSGPAAADYGQWVPCPGPWSPPLDYDSTWNDTGIKIDPNFTGAGGYFSKYGCQRDLNPSLRSTFPGMSVYILVNSLVPPVSITNLPNPTNSLPVTSLDCIASSYKDYYPIKFVASWPENGQRGSQTTTSSITTIISNINTTYGTDDAC